MKTLHVPFHFYPEAVGGTEVYALALVKLLQQMGHEAEVAAPGVSQECYVHDGVTVHRFAVGRIGDVSALYGAGNEFAAAQFDEILNQTEPDLVHLHGISPAISLSLLRRIKRQGVPTILTVHIPGILCSRGTLLEHGTEVCDGVIGVQRCGQCALEAKGLPPALSQILGMTPAAFGRVLAMTGLQGSWVTALRMTELQTLWHAMLRQFFEEVDSIVAVSEWLRQTLLRNGLPEDKILLCRHGRTQAVLTKTPPPAKHARIIKQIAYLGRLNEAKGVHVLVDAMLRSPELPLGLDIFGIVQEGASDSYAQRLRAKSECDNRIRFLAPVPNEEIPLRLREYDALAIPSVWLETGPLTVYDAFAAGIPVIGSRRGGIAELVTHERDGLLVEAGDVQAWSAALERICTESGLLEMLTRSVRQPRTMHEVADEMIGLYNKLLNSDSCRYAEPTMERHGPPIGPSTGIVHA